MMSERRSSSVLHAATFCIMYSSTNSDVPRAAPRCQLPVHVMWMSVSTKILSALGRCSSFTTSHDLELGPWHVPTILRERLGVTGTTVLLQHFKSKVYENCCNALPAACNASCSHAILAHTMRFSLEQMLDNSCITKHSSFVCNTSYKSMEQENCHVTTLEKYSNTFPLHIVGEVLPLHIDERSNQKRFTCCSIPA